VLTQGTGTVVSKEEGGRWGLAHLPRPERTLVGQALECYRGLWDVSPEQRSTGGLRWDIADLRRFRDYVVREAARLMPDTARG
jgi:streptomycin 3"-adenylyltransferase